MNIIQFDSHGNSLFSYSAVNFIYRNMFENLPILTRCVLSYTVYDSKHFKYNKKKLNFPVHVLKVFVGKS